MLTAMTTHVTESRAINVPVAARMLGVSARTIYRWIDEDKCPFPVINNGTRILVPLAPLERLLGGESIEEK